VMLLAFDLRNSLQFDLEYMFNGDINLTGCLQKVLRKLKSRGKYAHQI